MKRSHLIINFVKFFKMVGFKNLLAGAVIAATAFAETHVYNWTTGWGNYNPDGNLERPVITCNGEFPWPDVEVNKGDTVIVYLTNGFDNMNTSLHFHGLFQEGTNQMDGPEMVTQCPIAINQTFVYNFTVNQAGAYWYHSHTKAQYMDGMRGTFIIHDTDPIYVKGVDYDEEIVITLSEWYSELTSELLPEFLNKNNPTGAEPIPTNFLLSNTRNKSINVEPDTTYYIRLINIGGFTSYYFFIEDHDMTVVEVDGVDVDKNVTDLIYITVAQRYSFLLTTKNDTSKNFAIQQNVDQDMLDTLPDDLVVNATSFLVYSEDNDQPEEYVLDEYDILDDFYLVPVSRTELYPDADQTITVDVIMDNLINGVNYAFFSNLTYVAPKTPTLLTVLAAGDEATNELIYGSNTDSFVLGYGETIDIVVNNQDTGKHPFHLHGHTFQLISRADAVDDDEDPVPFDEDDHEPFPEYPMMRDTAYVRGQSNMVLRFQSNNPGVWFFHCHIEWHLEQGLALVLIEAPLEIQANASQALSESHINTCDILGINKEGNAAGNSDLTDLTGENVQLDTIPLGFTAKGIIAMTFSCLAAILGLVAISIYGLLDIKNLEEKVIRNLDINPDLLFDDDESDEKKRDVNINDGSSSNEQKSQN